MRAYIFENSNLDQREPHDSGVEATLDDLKDIGILYWKFDGPDALQQIDALATERNYKNRDQITVSPDALGDVYEDKVKTFFAEHLHEDEEIRYILDGTGYFDVRDKNDVWIRIAMEKGDMIILPAGIYHRFTTDSNNYLTAMRLFKEDPLWTPINRPLADDNQYRLNYLNTFNITAP
ncbi:Acireductone dioxygenase ARD family [Halteromyces radiatus]|uniref:Acireductone dioxygenase ARD family n=1 Tax=Halteromyces radiatus TaxID=101107 RepID=UPI0022208CF6|nr:Acireductone dioxygenase ARD family [Halteromyces radiatus]KAI8096911.1 Acireductone dioxygenase ARD family [Halteromyces radiatus]